VLTQDRLFLRFLSSCCFHHAGPLPEMFPVLPRFRIIVESGKRMSWDSELEDFKSKIDLREYAAGQGYTLDRRESWRGSAVMRNGGDKVVIKLNSNGHYIYFR